MEFGVVQQRKNLVPELGIEPRWAQGPGDFESPASTSFTTPASICKYIGGLLIVKKEKGERKGSGKKGKKEGKKGSNL